MRRLLASTIALLLVAAGPPARHADGRVSSTSPLAGQCTANDRTVLYGDAQDVEEELAIAVNPADPSNVVLAWTQDLGSGIVVGTTHDGGRSWDTVAVPGLSTCTGGVRDRVIHPRLSFGPDGVVYLLTSPLDGFFPDPRSLVADLAVSRSFDGGRTWTDPSLVNDLPVLNDLGGLAAEPDTPGAAVVAWSSSEAVLDTVVVSRTTDHGVTWQSSDVRLPTAGNVAGKVVVAHPDGSLLLFVREEPLDAFVGLPVSQRPLRLIRSTDKGATWSAPVELAADTEAYFWPLTSVGPDGAVHVVWGTATDDGLQLHLRTSHDAGASWGPVREVGEVERFDAVTMQPSLVAGPDGLLALAHFARADQSLGVLLTVSSDGGATWTTRQLVEPYAEGTVEHWALGPAAVVYQLGLAVDRAGVIAGFVGSGALAEEGVTDVFVTRWPWRDQRKANKGGNTTTTTAAQTANTGR